MSTEITAAPSNVPDKIAIDVDADGVARVSATSTTDYVVRTSWGTMRQSVTVSALSDAIGAYELSAAIMDAHATATRRARQTAEDIARVITATAAAAHRTPAKD